MVDILRSEIDFDQDRHGSLVYWDSVTRKYLVLEPGCEILDPNLALGKVGQQNVLPAHFELKPKDLELTQVSDEDGFSVGDPVLPGISMFVFFGSNNSGQHSLESIAKKHLGRNPHPKNRIYITQVGDINDAEWSVIFVPLINKNYPIHNPLHVIVVPNSVSAGRCNNSTENEKIAIANTFIKWDC